MRKIVVRGAGRGRRKKKLIAYILVLLARTNDFKLANYIFEGSRKEWEKSKS